MNHYIDNSSLGPTTPPGNRINNSAFTLTEMLVAMLILSVGIALIVGVGSVVRQRSQAAETRNVQAVLASALKLYYESQNAWPPGDGGENSTAELLRLLRANRLSRAELDKLPQGTVIEDDTGREFVLDGFGNKMRYFRTGGLGGQSPLISSLGADPKDPADDINMDVN
jgi:prepilin-type N-terminal cleavage/methylation domain-containing protein